MLGIDSNIIKKFVLKEILSDNTVDMDKYVLSSFDVDDIMDDIIHVLVNFKSKKSELVETIINDQPVSMDFVIVKTFEIKMSEYNKYLRSKKLTKITDGI